MEELPFPSVTICSPGLNMEAVGEALLEDFNHWLSETRRTDGNLEDWLDEFMEEKYATTAENIFETIKAMNSPPPSSEKDTSSRASAVLQNLVACKAKEAESIRKKRSNEGKTQSLIRGSLEKAKVEILSQQGRV